jgi:hypothetical protein
MKRTCVYVFCIFTLVLAFPLVEAKEIFNGYIYGYEERVFDGQPISFTPSGDRVRVSLGDGSFYVLRAGECRGNDVYTFCLLTFYADSCEAHNPQVSSSPRCVLGSNSVGAAASAARFSIDRKDVKLTITSSLSNATLFLGEQYKVTLTLKNEGELPIRDLRIEDVYPSEILLVSAQQGSISRNTYFFERYVLAVGETLILEYTLLPRLAVETTQRASISYVAGGQSFETSHSPIVVKLQQPLQFSVHFLDRQQNRVTPDVNQTYAAVINITNRRPNAVVIEDLEMQFPSGLLFHDLNNRTFSFQGQLHSSIVSIYDGEFQTPGPFSIPISYRIDGISYMTNITLQTLKQSQSAQVVLKEDFSVDLLIPRSGEFLERSSTTIGVLVRNIGDLPLSDLILVFDAGEYALESFEVSSLGVGEARSFNTKVIQLPRVSTQVTLPVRVDGYMKSVNRSKSGTIRVYPLGEALVFSHQVQKNALNPTEFTITQSVRNVLRQPIRDVEFLSVMPDTVKSFERDIYRLFPLIDAQQQVVLSSHKVEIPQGVSANFSSVATVGNLQDDFFAYFVKDFMVSNEVAPVGSLQIKVSLPADFSYLEWNDVIVTYQNPTSTRFFDVVSYFHSPFALGDFATSNILVDLAPGESITRTFKVLPFGLTLQNASWLYVSYRDASVTQYGAQFEIAPPVIERAFSQSDLSIHYELHGEILELVLVNSGNSNFELSFPLIQNASTQNITVGETVLAMTLSEVEVMRILAEGLSVNLFANGAQMPLKIPHLQANLDVLQIQEPGDSSSGLASMEVQNVDLSSGAREEPSLVVTKTFRERVFDTKNLYFVYVGVLLLSLCVYLFWKVRE